MTVRREGVPRWALAVLRSRLLHFFALGAVLTLAFGETEDDSRVTIDSERLAAIYRDAQRERPHEATTLAREELDQLVREELLVREAARLGLGESDSIVRTRLREILLSPVIKAAEREPITAAELNAEREAIGMGEEPIATFRYLFVQGSGPEARAEADRLHRRLAAGESLGDGEPAVRDAEAMPRKAVAHILGTSVADAVFDSPAGAWSTPVAAAYGFYLVRVDERNASDGLAPIAVAERAIRERRANDAVARYLAQLSERHTVEVAEASWLEDYRFDPERTKNR